MTQGGRTPRLERGTDVRTLRRGWLAVCALMCVGGSDVYARNGLAWAARRC